MAARATLADVAERLRREGLLAGERGLADRAAARPVTEAWTGSRKVKSGHLFCAYAGAEIDSHRFLAEVSARGSAGATVEKRTNVSVCLPASAKMLARVMSESDSWHSKTPWAP